MSVHGRSIELKIPNILGYEKLAMETAGQIARLMGFPESRVEDLCTAVAEACINAMEHGNSGDAATKIFITLTPHADRLAIDVLDAGRTPPPRDVALPDLAEQLEGRAPPGGMGLFVIRALVDQAEFVEPDLGTGNQFRMVIHLQPDAPPTTEDR